MKIYIATPISNRPELTLMDRLRGARARVDDIVRKVREPGDLDISTLSQQATKEELEEIRKAEFCSTFDVNAMSDKTTEPEAMGNCIRLVLECDAVLVDNSIMISHGVLAESSVAGIYGKKRYLFKDAAYDEELVRLKWKLANERHET